MEGALQIPGKCNMLAIKGRPGDTGGSVMNGEREVLFLVKLTDWLQTQNWPLEMFTLWYLTSGCHVSTKWRFGLWLLVGSLSLTVGILLPFAWKGHLRMLGLQSLHLGSRSANGTGKWAESKVWPRTRIWKSLFSLEIDPHPAQFWNFCHLAQIPRIQSLKGAY